MQWLRQSTAATVTIGPILDSAGAEYTGAVIGDISIRKHDGTSSAALASAATLTHDSNGMYKLVLTTGNVDTLGRLDLHCNKSTYQMPPKCYDVVPAMVYDSLVLGTDVLQADVTQLLGTAWLAPGTAGTPDVNVKLWNGLATVALPLVPTTAGRTLDVSAGGEAGIDWANVGSPTTTNNLSGTTIKTATDVETDTADIQSRIPTALGANGNIKADVRDYNGTAGTFSGGRPEVNASHWGGTAVASANVLIDGAITAAKIANNAIDAATFAADVDAEVLSWIVDDATRIDASALNTATGTTIPSILDDTDLIDDGTSGLAKIATDVAAVLVDTGTTLDGKINDILADTNELQTDWVNGGRLDLILDTINAAVAAAAIRAAVGLAGASLDTQLDAIPTAAENTAAVWALANIEPTAIPGATATMKQAMSYFLLVSIGKHIVDATDHRLRNTADSADVATHPHSDSGTEFISDAGS